MSKTTEEKIDAMYTMLLTLNGRFEAMTQVCDLKHKALNEKVDDFDHELNGNGDPGLIKRHQTLKQRLDNLEWKLGLVITVCFFFFQIYGDKIKHFLGVI